RRQACGNDAEEVHSATLSETWRHFFVALGVQTWTSPGGRAAGVSRPARPAFVERSAFIGDEHLHPPTDPPALLGRDRAQGPPVPEGAGTNPRRVDAGRDECGTDRRHALFSEAARVVTHHRLIDVRIEPDVDARVCLEPVREKGDLLSAIRLDLRLHCIEVD